MSASARLAAALQQARDRVIWISAIAGAAWSCVCVVLSLVVAIWLDLLVELPAWLRAVWWLIAVGVGVACFVRAMTRMAASTQERWLARQFDSACQTHGEVVSGLELSLNPQFQKTIRQSRVRDSQVMARVQSARGRLRQNDAVPQPVSPQSSAPPERARLRAHQQEAVNSFLAQLDAADAGTVGHPPDRPASSDRAEQSGFPDRPDPSSLTDQSNQNPLPTPPLPTPPRPELTRDELTAGLAEAAVQRASWWTQQVAADAAVSSRPATRSIMAILLLAVLLTGAGFLMPRLAATELRRFVDPFGDNPPWSALQFDVTPGEVDIEYGADLEIQATVIGETNATPELVWVPQPGDETTSGNSLSSARRDERSRHDAASRDRTIAPQPAEHFEVLPMFADAEGGWRTSLASLNTPGEYFVQAGRSRSRRFPVTLRTIPRIVDTRVRLTPPAYTGLSPTFGPVPDRGLSGLPGTRVTVMIRSNRPLSRGNLSCVTGDDAQHIRMEPADLSQEFALLDIPEIPHMVQGTFEIRASGRLDATITDISEQSSADSFTTSVTLLKDEAPYVKIVEPLPQSFATPNAIIPIKVLAEDDYGLAGTTLFQSVNDNGFESRDLPLHTADESADGASSGDGQPPEREPVRYIQHVVMLPLADLKLESGDVVRLFARAVDTDPVVSAEGHSGKGTESSVVTLHIVSEEEVAELTLRKEGMAALQNKYQQARRRLESLAARMDETLEKLSKAEAGNPLEQELRDELQQLARQADEEREALEKLADRKLPTDIEEELNKLLEGDTEMLQRLTKNLEQMASDESLTAEQAREQLQQMRKQLAQEREQLDEEALESLEAMSRMMPLLQDQQRFETLAQQQRDLATRIESLKDRDPATSAKDIQRLRELEDEQRQLAWQLDQLAADIEDHVDALPEDEAFDELRTSAREFVQTLRASGSSETMQQAEQKLAELSGGEGHRKADEAAKILESLLSQCESGMGQSACEGACQKFSPGQGRSMGQSLKQMMQPGMGSKPGSSGGTAPGGMQLGPSGSGQSGSQPMQNVGIYGGLPDDPSATPSQMEGPPGERQDGAGTPSTFGLGDDDAGDVFSRSFGPFRATGAGEGAIPPRYRRKVGRYFERVADETSQ